MASSRREFIAGVGGLGLVGLLTQDELVAEERRRDDASKQKGMPTMSMVIETVLTEGLAQLSYLIGDKATGKAAVIDPRRDVDVYIELARKHEPRRGGSGRRPLTPGVERRQAPCRRCQRQRAAEARVEKHHQHFERRERKPKSRWCAMAAESGCW